MLTNIIYNYLVTAIQLCGSGFSPEIASSLLISASADGTVCSTAVTIGESYSFDVDEQPTEQILSEPAAMTCLDVDLDSRCALATSAIGGFWTFSIDPVRDSNEQSGMIESNNFAYSG